jgi:hypothetical protein
MSTIRMQRIEAIDEELQLPRVMEPVDRGREHDYLGIQNLRV